MTTQTLTFNSSLNAKNTSKSFGLTVGSGMATAQLSFSKCNALSLTLRASSATVVTSSSGAVELVSNLTAGSYTYIVSGERCSFTLSVTAPRP